VYKNGMTLKIFGAPVLRASIARRHCLLREIKGHSGTSSVQCKSIDILALPYDTKCHAMNFQAVIGSNYHSNK